MQPTSHDPFSSNIKFTINAASDPKVFSQPLTVQQGNSTLIYRPKSIISRYVIGQPVAFTDQPILPVHYQHLSPSKPMFNNIPGVQTTSLHIPHYQNQMNLSKSIYRNMENDSVIESRKRTVSYDNKLSQSPSHINNSYHQQSQMSYVRKQTFDKILQQNTQLRNQNSMLRQQNVKIKTRDFTDNKGRDGEIIQLQRTISQLSQQIHLLKASKSMDLARTMATTSQNVNTNPFSQTNNLFNAQQIHDTFTSCLQKYRLSILEQQKLLIDRYRLQCKNDQLNQKKYKLEQSQRHEIRTKSRSSYQQQENYRPRQTMESPMRMKENQNLPYLPLQQDLHQKHWRRSRN